MAQQGAALQMYNNELVKCLEDLRARRADLNQQIQVEQNEKQKLQTEIRVLSEKLAKVNENLAKKLAAQYEYDKTIAETEVAYMKILDSSQALLGFLKKDSLSLKQQIPKKT